ncbi:transmembrane protein, putative (macronuclear) [Tetrahymena thermophila SB210]|uniref:Transmembrane protein, putative n=1 Tax=Tetrahymena thermophila (strain SB210) TaxID=312017 RepID=W7X9L7_TETTS|nr:transmembrane protein, putative [Tetrahymena thermophila SB210]EWS74037.1 transmembrane protein, putative [Tetrahymena thermophila SB210]|eukprot:XP_012653436.1 transmembrane protein, putative [Tetrahymena thermophila SB210]
MYSKIMIINIQYKYLQLEIYQLWLNFILFIKIVYCVENFDLIKKDYTNFLILKHQQIFWDYYFLSYFQILIFQYLGSLILQELLFFNHQFIRLLLLAINCILFLVNFKIHSQIINLKVLNVISAIHGECQNKRCFKVLKVITFVIIIYLDDYMIFFSSLNQKKKDAIFELCQQDINYYPIMDQYQNYYFLINCMTCFAYLHILGFFRIRFKFNSNYQEILLFLQHCYAIYYVYKN